MSLRLVFAFSLFAASLAAAPLAVRDGEKFTFRVSWGIFNNAAEITIAANEEEAGDGMLQTRIVTETATRGIIRGLYRFDGQAQSIFDTNTGRMISAVATTETGSKSTRATIAFDYDNARASYVDEIRPHRSLDLELPAGNPLDFITSLIQTRNWNIEPGESKPALVLFDDEFYELTITAVEETTIKTPWGRKRALLLVPTMQGEPKGMFKRGGEVRVWISRDEDPLPLRFDVKVAVGTAHAVLTDFTRGPGNEAVARAPSGDTEDL